MRVLIVGGGIGGLALAAQLRKRGIDSTIVEKCHQWRTIGYLLILYPNGMRMLDEIGIAGEIATKGANIKGFIAEDEHGRIAWENDMRRIKRLGGLTEIARDDLHAALRGCNKNASIRMGTTWTHLKQEPDGVSVTFSDGAVEKFDVVVGADGINSPTREYVHGRKPNYSGLTFWISWIPKRFETTHGVAYSLGRGKIVGLFPSHRMDRIAVIFLVAARENAIKNQDRSIPFLKEHFSDMGGSVPGILKLLPDEPAQMFHHDDDEVHLRDWSRGNVVLMGDAAHATSPILGMGASMALEDAHVLAEELAKTQSVSDALRTYRRRRMPRVRWVSRISKIVHWLIEVRMPGRLGGAFYAAKVKLLKHVFLPNCLRLIERFVAEKV